MVTDWEKVMEENWGRAFVHESGHALMAVLQNIPCHGIYFQKNTNKFCALTNLPPESEYSKEHYLFLTASGAAERIIYGNEDEDGAKADRSAFKNPGAPSLEETIDEAEAILQKNKRQLKRLVSMVKAKCRQADLNLNTLPEMNMEGTDKKFAVLLSKDELENAVRRA